MLNIGTVVLFAVYIMIFTPISLVYRLLRNDPLKLRRNPASRSYWQNRRNKRFRPMSSQY